MFYVGHDAIDAEEDLAFVMNGVLQTRVHHVQAAIEVADPQAAIAQRERGHVAISHDRTARGESGAPLPDSRIVTVNRIFGDCVRFALQVRQAENRDRGRTHLTGYPRGRPRP